jgi:hypothetical protein
MKNRAFQKVMSRASGRIEISWGPFFIVTSGEGGKVS